MANNNSSSLLKEVAKQVPSLIVLAVVVFMFLEREDERMAHLDTISGHCHDVQRDNIEVNRALVDAIHAAQRDNTTAHRALLDAINKLRIAIEKLAGDRWP
jgi:hypothetical protein